FAQLSLPMKSSRANRSLGYSDDLRCLRRRSLFDVTEHNRHTLFEWKSVKRAGEGRRELRASGMFLRIRRRWQRFHFEPRVDRSSAHRTSEVVTSMVHGNRHQKGAERGVAAKATDRPWQCKERILEQVFGRALITEKPNRKSSHMRVMRVVGFSKRCCLPLTQA